MSEAWSPTWPATPRCDIRWDPAAEHWVVTRADGSEVGTYPKLLEAERAAIGDRS